MIALPPGARMWLACGGTDMRRGMPGLALMVREGLKRDPRAGDLHVFRGRRGSLARIRWHDGLGMSLHAKQLEKGRFIRPASKEGSVAISAARLACLPGSTGGTRGMPGGRWRREERPDRMLPVDCSVSRRHPAMNSRP